MTCSNSKKNSRHWSEFTECQSNKIPSTASYDHDMKKTVMSRIGTNQGADYDPNVIFDPENSGNKTKSRVLLFENMGKSRPTSY